MKLIKKIFKTKPGRWVKYNIITRLAVLVIKLLSSLIAIKRVDFGPVKELARENKNVVYAFFHGEQFVLIAGHKNEGAVMMTSLSEDGNLQTKILKKLGFDIVRGSTKKGAASGARALIEKLESGKSIGLAVDGPKGPAFKVKPGVTFLAQKTQIPVVPVRVVIKNKIEFKAWDKYILPIPFTTAFIKYGQPIPVLPEDSLKKKTLEIQEKMLALVRR